MNKHISPNKKIVNDGLVHIIALVAMVTCVQKNTSIASLRKKRPSPSHHLENLSNVYVETAK